MCPPPHIRLSVETLGPARPYVNDRHCWKSGMAAAVKFLRMFGGIVGVNPSPAASSTHAARSTSATRNHICQRYCRRHHAHGHRLNSFAMKFVETQFRPSTRVKAVAFHPADPVVATSMFDGSVAQWNYKTGKEEWVYGKCEETSPTDPPNLSNDVTLVLNDTTGKTWHVELKLGKFVYLRDPEFPAATGVFQTPFGGAAKYSTGYEKERLHQDDRATRAVAFFRDMVISGHNDGTLRAFDMHGNGLFEEAEAHEDWIRCITV